MPEPLISVITPVYNHGHYLTEALKSVVNQTYKNLEIIIVDDGSTDDTPEVCKTLVGMDPRIKVITQLNKGPSAARNKAIAASHGDFICLFDADDVLFPNRIATQYEVLEKNPGIDLVYTAIIMVDNKGHPCGELHGKDYLPEDFLALMFFRNIIPNSNTILARRECFSAHPYNEKFIHAEDYELMMRLAHIYKFKYIDIPLTYYRRHTFNLSNDIISHREAERKVMAQYDPSHIAQVVSQTTFSEEEKTLLLGKIFFNQERFHEALDVLKNLETADSLFYQGNSYLYLQQYDLAEKCFKESISLDPSNAACHNNLGVVETILHHNNEAVASFKQAMHLKQDYLDPSYNLSHIHLPETLRITWRELRQNLIPYHL